MPFHPFHIVEQSPWPLIGSIRALILTTGLVNYMHNSILALLILGLTLTILTIYQWWRDICREATFQGLHTQIVKTRLKWGIILFISREILFFFRFFWTFFHVSLSPDIATGIIWPPSGITSFNPYNIPLLNTVVLLSSGVSITWSHHRILKKSYTEAILSLSVTILLGLFFSILQGFEYIEATFTTSDRVFGATFFILTGFHGLHVIIGTTFLFINLTRIINGHLRSSHHLRFEAAAWYWHFVDVVWLFLYISLYWWIYYLISITKYI